MAATYSATVIPTVNVKSTNAIVASSPTSTTIIQALFPDGNSPVTFASGTGALAINKFGYGSISLAASASTVDLTTVSSVITNWIGDTSFTKLKIVCIRNDATVSTTKPVIVGNAASNAFTGPMGGTTPTETVEAGCAILWFNGESGGWTVDGTHKSLKLDPAANTITVTVILGGN